METRRFGADDDRFRVICSRLNAAKFTASNSKLHLIKHEKAKYDGMKFDLFLD